MCPSSSSDFASDVSPDTLVSDLLARMPLARAMLDRYGLRGCGGRRGPAEPLRLFARTHGIDLTELLESLRTLAGTGEQSRRTVALPVAHVPSAADTIYRRFFVGAILAGLTAGAAWGVWLLLRISMAGRLTGVSIHQVNAHGHAQVFGWVGLFIMGFAYQAFPRMWRTTLAMPRLAPVAFIVMVTGVVLGVVGTASAEAWEAAAPLAALGGLLECSAVLLFGTQMLVTFRRSGIRADPSVGFVFAAIAWFVLMSEVSVWHTWGTMAARSNEELLEIVSTYQAGLRNLQVHGLALFMILGVSLRMLPGVFGLPRISAARGWWSLGLLLAAVIGEVAMFLVYRWTGSHVAAGALWGAWALLPIGVGVLVWPWRLWRPVPEPNRSAKFVRTAYGWLAVSFAMLLLLPAYQAVSGLPFSHAYYGAVRHAATVGFVSLMIMGMAAKVVPTLNGADPKTLGALWGPFALVNIGCALRVGTQTLTDWNPGFFSVIGISGALELTGLTWWGIHLLRIMMRGKRELRMEEAPAPAGAPPGAIGADHRVADVLAWFPATMKVFDEFGFTPLRNPILRMTVARHVTIGSAAKHLNVGLSPLLRRLNEAISAESSACGCCAACGKGKPEIHSGAPAGPGCGHICGQKTPEE